MDTKIYLAPMAGVTDLPFRLMSRRFGARLCFFEMMDANAINYNHKNNKSFLRTKKEDSPIAAQLLGPDPDTMLDAAYKLLELVKVPFLDVNSACPARKVLKKKAGSGLLNDLDRLGRILNKLSKNIKIPITVKLRIGYDKIDAKLCARIAMVCEANGASMIFIHGRTAAQNYSGDIDYGSIKAVKDAVKIPVFGSGNIFDPILAKKMVDETGCDGVLVARGAMGNPWIFREIEEYLKNGKIIDRPSLEEKKQALKDHLSLVKTHCCMSPFNKIGYMGKISMWYLKGVPNAARIRERINKTKTFEELLEVVDV